MDILVITTGGTIGALPYKDPTRPPQFVAMPPEGRDLVQEALVTHFPAYQTRCLSLPPTDSKLMDEVYCTTMLTAMAAAPEKATLVTHGTDALLQTADFMHQHMQTDADLRGKILIITGAMIPLANGVESDGYRNLAFALQSLQDTKMPPGAAHIVLCDFDQNGVWAPRLYRYKPGMYKKFYDADGRYNRIILSSD